MVSRPVVNLLLYKCCLQCLVILDHSFAVLFNFRNFCNECFALFRIVFQIMFPSFANTRFTRFSQDFANRFFVSQVLQGFPNGQFADEWPGSAVMARRPAANLQMVLEKVHYVPFTRKF